MIKWQKITAAVFLCVMLPCAAGCNGKTDLSGFSENTLAVNRDGSVTELAVESFGEEYYSLDELKTFVADEVDKYNEEHPSESGKEKDQAIIIDEVRASEEEAKVVLTYKTPEDYSDFNYTRMEISEVSQLPEDAAALELQDAQGADAGTVSSLESAEQYTAVITCTAGYIAVPGKIAYVSSNVTISDKSSAKGDGTLSVIIYK